MDITLCIPTLRRFDLLRLCVDSALEGTLKPTKILIIDNSSGELTRQQFYHHTLPIYVHTPAHNLGVAASWNFFMRTNEDQIIICNDDIIFSAQAIECIVSHYGADFIAANGQNAFSCFSLKKSIYEHVGPFDETFYPAYFEDNDYARRLLLHGYTITSLPGDLYTHTGSATLKSYTPEETQLHHSQFATNHSYYISKWGGPPEQETKGL